MTDAEEEEEANESNQAGSERTRQIWDDPETVERRGEGFTDLFELPDPPRSPRLKTRRL